jgi:uncharacterized membrane protein YjgN (DUF898 family)
VRFHQTGSAWRYALCALLWWTLILLTLGLAYPFAQSRLERFKMRNTFFGNLPGRFEGSGLNLLARGLLLWFLAIVPFVAGIVATLMAVDWSTLAAADDIMSWLETSGLGGAVVYAGLTCLWLLLSFAILYPIFQAMLLRWWTSGLRFGDLAVASRLRTSQVFGVYARFLWYAFLFTLIAGQSSSPVGLACTSSPASSIPFATRSSPRSRALPPMSQSRSATPPYIKRRSGSGCGGAW